MDLTFLRSFFGYLALQLFRFLIFGFQIFGFKRSRLRFIQKTYILIIIREEIYNRDIQSQTKKPNDNWPKDKQQYTQLNVDQLLKSEQHKSHKNGDVFMRSRIAGKSSSTGGTSRFAHVSTYPGISLIR